MLCVLKAAVVWFVIFVADVNLLGLIVRGFFPPKFSTDFPSEEMAEFLGREIRRYHSINRLTTFGWFVAMVGYFYAVYRCGNILLVATAGLLMVSRLPDLLWEIRTGQLLTVKSTPDGFIYRLGFVLMLLSVPLTWYALCAFPD